MSEHETIADIIAEMRKTYVSKGGAGYCGEVWIDLLRYADRIEAAHRREMATTKESLAVGNSGDCAKLREAIAKCVNLITEFGNAEIVKTPLDVIIDIEAILKAALAAPPRNCDEYATADEALKAQEQMFNDSNFANGECKLGCPECDNPRVGCKIAWLFAPATEKEGGNDGH